MATLNEDLLAVSLEGFNRSAPLPSQVDETLTYSEEGWKGALKGFLVGGVASALTFGVGGAIIGAKQKEERVLLKKQIDTIADRIAQIHNGDVEKAKKAGKSVPSKQDVKLDGMDVVKSALLGYAFSGIYNGYSGHKIEELEKELEQKMKELEAAFSAAK